MNNNIIPACIIGAGLFAVALKPAPQPAPIPQAEPVAVATASVTGPSEPVIVWYGTASHSSYQFEPNSPVLLRAWSDGTIEGFKMTSGSECNPLTPCSSGWFVISTPQMACRTDVNGNGEIEFGDILAVLNQWGDQATCPDTVQLQCGLGLPNG
jgi:hypothetical protein